MPSLSLWSAAVVLALIIASFAFLGPVAAAGGSYPATVKLISGFTAMAGSLYLARAVSLTLLRSGGTPAFRAAYVAAAALAGLGLAEVISALVAANIGYALAAYCLISLVSGVLWVRFYGTAT